MRGVCGSRYGYIYNPWSDGAKVYSSESQDGLTWNAMVAAAPGDTNIQARVNLFKYRVVEELYDYTQDSDAIYNLVQKPEMAPYIYTARQNLLSWMIQIQDPMLAGFQSYTAAHPLPADVLTSRRVLGASRSDNPDQINLQYPTSSNMLYQIRTSIDLTIGNFSAAHCKEPAQTPPGPCLHCPRRPDSIRWMSISIWANTESGSEH